jgi:hypothetical protein
MGLHVLAKNLKWWMYDLWMLMTARSGRQEPKTVHLLFCRICDGYHRAYIRFVGSISRSEMPSDEAPYESGKQCCPITGEVFYSAADDWLHLTERQYDLAQRKR